MKTSMPVLLPAVRTPAWRRRIDRPQLLGIAPEPDRIAICFEPKPSPDRLRAMRIRSETNCGWHVPVRGWHVPVFWVARSGPHLGGTFRSPPHSARDAKTL
ncbi:MAG: hypothetical protein EA381_11935 [Planctomycetaceae bacterium]|nr:MAG: hypothetical protein EA381_11935 [Planctomycetaceae bacterium]